MSRAVDAQGTQGVYQGAERGERILLDTERERQSVRERGRESVREREREGENGRIYMWMGEFRYGFASLVHT